MADPGSQIETLRERIEESDEISDDDRDALLEFSDELYLLQTEYGDHRHLKLLRHCTRMAEHVGGSPTLWRIATPRRTSSVG